MLAYAWLNGLSLNDEFEEMRKEAVLTFEPETSEYEARVSANHLTAIFCKLLNKVDNCRPNASL